MTTYGAGAVSDDKVGIMTTPGFQWTLKMVVLNMQFTKTENGSYEIGLSLCSF